MIKGDFVFKDEEGVEIYVYKWLPDIGIPVRGMVQIAHGMAETAARYERFAEHLTKNGYIVYANDHRGHGKTAKTLENVGYPGEDGFNWMIKDMKELNDIMKQENANLPLFLFGHSLGAMLAQGYITLYGDTINGVILSGTSGKQGIMLDIGILLAAREVRKNGPSAKSTMLNKLTFGGYNNAFKPYRTDFDWLSRDTREVDKYVNDPFCGSVFSAGFFYYFFKGLKEIHKKSNMSKIPKSLPIYIFSGGLDPVSKSCRTLYTLMNTYRNLGIDNVNSKIYKGGRREMLNEINRDEVTQDVINWLDRNI